MSLADVIDSIIITEERDTNKVIADWSTFDSGITAYTELKSAQAVKLFINWSDKNGTVALRQGDYFTFDIPDLFMYDYINNVTGINIVSESGEVVAVYSIYDNTDNNLKEIKITFTDYVETHTKIVGDFWILLFVGSVNKTEIKHLEFIINGNIKAEGDVKVNPKSALTPNNRKTGFSLPSRSAGGYYIFEWLVFFNMEQNDVNGFNVLEDFSFEDKLPSDSPHVFLTDEIKQQLAIPSTLYAPQIGEYLGTDSYPVENRYPTFLYHYNSTDDNIWYNFINWHTLENGLSTVGIDKNGGLDVSDIMLTEKLFSAVLGRITRPSAIRFYTISTIKITESALGDSEVVKLFKNNFMGNHGQNLESSLTLYRFESGGSAQGITGDYSFSFTKINQHGNILPGALFSLYTSEDFSAGADRFVYSDDGGIVTFKNLPEGTYYILETTVPAGYADNTTVYKAILNKNGCEIYYGENYEIKLSDYGNKIVNRFKTEPFVSVTLTARKNLTGRTLSGGMFNFNVKNVSGTTIATGNNDAAGVISFNEIKFNSAGEYTFIVEEVIDGYSGITYDSSKFFVKVFVTEDILGNLFAAVFYPDGEITFNNRYAETPPVKPCPCLTRATKCRKSIKANKVWLDNDDFYAKRPSFVEIVLTRDGENYKTATLNPANNWSFTFVCLPVWKNSGEKYDYKIDEPKVPDGYSKSVNGFIITNTLD